MFIFVGCSAPSLQNIDFHFPPTSHPSRLSRPISEIPQPAQDALPRKMPQTRLTSSRHHPKKNVLQKTTRSSLSTEVKEPRHVSDTKTWKIMLGTMEVEPSTVPDFVLESACFELSYFREGPTYGHWRYHCYTIHAHAYEACVLKYTYMTSQTRIDLLWGFLKVGLDGLTRGGFQIVGEEEKPAYIVQPNPPGNGFYMSNSTSEKPPTWRSSTI
ncbi:hypothetical protein BGZ57DRAFT_946714 [Hyaloscypha finlandica]|nr:hypothetical protein BGZ57DRAFT_946714 [Hyaloscypha finlandica]